ncbi:alpha/beta hydrolase [Compostibacter hankyongensis]|uniref:Alpha/beta hydrolase n=1 Tax=Compostibacter hankyongensis TaxID=1007089 RepID=A0ABP8G4E0_9BACT
MKKFLRILAIVVAVLLILYIAGPREHVQDLSGPLPAVPQQAAALDTFVQNREARVPGLKPDNEARIIWADPAQPQKTRYSIVYLHGFGASWAEGAPVHRQLAKTFGCNLYLSRLAEHGIDRPDAFSRLTAQSLVASAREALAVGEALGDSVILMGTSMGGALILYLASEHPELKAVIVYSPLVEDFGHQLPFLFKPWGTKLLQLVNFKGKSEQHVERPTAAERQYWSENFHVNAYRSLAVLAQSTMHDSTFQKIRRPLFLGYYYRDSIHQDSTVSVAAELHMFDALATPAGEKEKKAFPRAGDHVIGSYIRSGDVDGVFRATADFLETRAGLQPAAQLRDTTAIAPPPARE